MIGTVRSGHLYNAIFSGRIDHYLKSSALLTCNVKSKQDDHMFSPIPSSSCNQNLHPLDRNSKAWH